MVSLNKKIKNIKLKAILLFIVFTTFISSIPITNIYAEEENPVTDAKAYMYYAAMKACITYPSLNVNASSQSPQTIALGALKESDASSGNWFKNTGTNPKIGYFANAYGLSSDGAQVGCGGNDIDWIKDAVKTWGYSSPIEALCDFGIKRANGQDCIQGSGDFVGTITSRLNVSDYEKSVKSKMSGVDSLTQAGRYEMYHNVFFVGCLGDINKQPNPSAPDDDFTYKISVYDSSTKSVVENKYYGSKKKTDTISYGEEVRSIGTSPLSATCEELSHTFTNELVSAYATYDKANPGAIEKKQDETKTTDEGKSTCNIDGVGWIICPIVNFLAKTADEAFKFLSNNFLYVDAKLVDDTSTTYKAWAVMRNFANIAFVIAFLIIIFSQLTNLGVTNYGIKKMLPRLIIAAILVNLSFLICQIAVDLSNILGFSMNRLLTNIGNTAAGADLNTAQASMGWWQKETDGFTGLMGKILALGVSVIFLYLAISIPVLIAAIVGLGMILFILIARQAIIIILITVAPLAFVAFLLPNTENLFKKWQKTFTTMLLIFPIVSVIFGASCLASKILSATFVSSAANDTSSFMGQLVAAGAMVLPLFLVPGILKKSIDGVGNLGTKLSGIGDKIGGAAGTGLSKAYDNTSLARGKVIRKQAKQDYRNQQYARKLTNEGGATRRISSGLGLTKTGRYANEQLVRAAKAEADKADDKDVANEEIVMRSKYSQAEMLGGATKEYADAIQQNNVTRAVAAQNILLKSGGKGIGAIHETIKKYDSGDKDVRGDKSDIAMNALLKGLNSAGLKAKDNVLATRAFTDKPISDIAKEQSVFSGLSPTELAGQSTDVLREAVDGGVKLDAYKSKMVLNNPNTTQMLDTEEKVRIFERAASRDNSNDNTNGGGI